MCAVVNICKLNDLVIPDAYLLFLQSDIIASVEGYTNWAILDTASFFYQRLLHLDHQYMFTVVIHQEQENIQGLIIAYINLVAYI